jgi:hypothetical protein
MTLFALMGLLTTIALITPVFSILINKLSLYKSFPILLFYYSILVIYNFLNLGYITVSKDLLYYLGNTCNLLDTPLMLLFMSYFSQTASFRKKLYILTVGFGAFETLIVAIYGLSTKAATIVLAPGFLLVIGLSLVFFIHQVKIAVVHHKAIGKAIMSTSILFAYVGYAFVYTVYYIIQSPQTADTYLIYFLITIASSVSMSTGVFFERHRVKKLDELKTTRKELKDLYGNKDQKKTTPPFGKVALNFDSDQWS